MGVRVLAALHDLADRFLGRPPRPRALRPNRWTIEEAERRIRREPVEWAFVFDPAGRQVIRRRGTRRLVAFDAVDLPKLPEATLVHNHPIEHGEDAEAQTFSRLDLVFAVRHNLAELRVVAGDWRFVLGRPLGGWPADEDVVLEVYNEIQDAARAEFRTAVADGRVTSDERDALVRQEVMTRVAARGFCDYRRERISTWP